MLLASAVWPPITARQALGADDRSAAGPQGGSLAAAAVLAPERKSRRIVEHAFSSVASASRPSVRIDPPAASERRPRARGGGSLEALVSRSAAHTSRSDVLQE